MIRELLSPVWLLLSLILFAYLPLRNFLLRKKPRKETSNFAFEKRTRLPPGRTGWPLLGENVDYFSRLRQGVLDKFVTQRKNKYSSNIFRTSLIGQPMTILCNAEGNKFLFSSEKKLVEVWFLNSFDKIFPKSDSEASNEHSKRLRKVLHLILKADMFREYVRVMDVVMKEQLQADWNCKEVKVGDMAKKYVFTLACNIFLGISDPGKIDELAKGMEEIATGLHSIPLNFPGTALNRAIKASRLMRKKVELIVRQRKSELSANDSSSGKDLMSYMLLDTDDNGQFFKEEDIASHLVGLMQAGYTTVYGTITLIMKYLAELPDVYNSVLREQNEITDLKGPKDELNWEDLRKMKYSWGTACEVLRLMPPALGGFREAITGISYAGFTIPRGWKIHWIVAATHKNPEYFPDPEKFDPSRFQGDGPARYTFVPFGGGSRMCPGHEYARLTILVFMHNLVTKFRWEMLIPDEKILYDPVPRLAQGLPVRLHPHKP